MNYHSVPASVPLPGNITEDKLFKLDAREMRLAWTVGALPDSSGKDSWVSHSYFSTLPVASMPDSGRSILGNAGPLHDEKMARNSVIV